MNLPDGKNQEAQQLALCQLECRDDLLNLLFPKCRTISQLGFVILF